MGVDALGADGFEEACIGHSFTHEGELCLVYDTEKCLDILMADSDMTRSDAVEYFDFNVAGAYVGPQTPIWVETLWS